MLDALQQRLEANGHRVLLVPEAVDEWEQHGLLRDFYAGDISAATFQLVVAATNEAKRKRAFAEAAELLEAGNVIALLDRCGEIGGRAFAEVSLNAANMRCHAVLCSALVTLGGNPCDIEGVVYLDTSVPNCSRRIAARARASESVDEEYLLRIEQAYQRVLRDTEDVVTVDGNQATPDVLAACLRGIEHLIG